VHADGEGGSLPIQAMKTAVKDLVDKKHVDVNINEIVNMTAKGKIPKLILDSSKYYLLNVINEFLFPKKKAIHECLVLIIFGIRGILRVFGFLLVCKALDKSLAANKTPLILDMTSAGIPSETVKAFAAAMALPTVTTAYGKRGEIKLVITLYHSIHTLLLIHR